jgi:hypothetical protein
MVPQWSLLGVGAAIGGLIPLIQTFQTGATESVSTSSYVAFIIIGQSCLIPTSEDWKRKLFWQYFTVLIGIAASTLLSNPRDVHRKDGTPVLIEATPSYKDEVVNILKLVKDHKILLLTPAFLASNWVSNFRVADYH